MFPIVFAHQYTQIFSGRIRLTNLCIKTYKKGIVNDPFLRCSSRSGVQPIALIVIVNDPFLRCSSRSGSSRPGR